MSEQAVEFWCKLPIELSEVFGRFRATFSVDNFIHDAENVWEWFDGRTADDKIGFNITRQWDEDEIPDEPVRFSLLIRDPKLSANTIGERLARGLRADVQMGIVTYCHGDRFDFASSRTFRASPG